MSENPEETLDPLKKFFIFAPFQPISAPFELFGVLPIVQSRKERKKGTAATLPPLPVVLMLPRNRGRTEEGKPCTTQQNEEHNKPSCPDGAGVVGVLPMLLAYQERKPTRTEERKKGNERGAKE